MPTSTIAARSSSGPTRAPSPPTSIMCWACRSAPASVSSTPLTANTARNIVTNAINISGVVQAQSVSMQNGEIVLDAGPGGGVAVSGKLDVSGRGAGQTGGTV